jgi:hypothetical protein
MTQFKVVVNDHSTAMQSEDAEALPSMEISFSEAWGFR